LDLSPRQEEILDILRAEGRVETEPLAVRFGVTSQTIRRDLGELCDRGLAARMHGGARRIASVANSAYNERRAINASGKEAIGTLAATLIPDNCSLMLNIGTTTEHVARALGGHSGLVVISNNINIITQMMGGPMRELILAGGTVRASDGAIVGEQAVAFISQYKADFAVIGASALDADGAVLDFDAREVSVARAILKNARTHILVADRSKFDHTAPVRICSVSELDYIVTDLPPPPGFVEAAKAGDTRILTAGHAHEL